MPLLNWFCKLLNLNVRLKLLLLVTSLLYLPSVIAQFNPGTIGYNQTICNGSRPETLIELTSPSGGTGYYTFQWQSSSDNRKWKNISRATDLNYTPPVIRTNTWYRRNVTSGSYGTLSSNSVLVAVYPRFDPGVIGNSQTIFTMRNPQI